MANERCPKCGEPLTNFNRGGELVFDCHYDPKDCRIIELQRESATFKATAQGLLNFQKQDRERIAELESLLRASEARELVLRDALMDYGRHIQSIPELGIVGCDFDPEIGATCTCGLRPALSNTSATAQETVERIEREALEKFIAIITNPENEIVWRRPERGSIHADSRFIRAAILGEKEANDGHQDRTP